MNMQLESAVQLIPMKNIPEKDIVVMMKGVLDQRMDNLKGPRNDVGHWQTQMT